MRSMDPMATPNWDATPNELQDVDGNPSAATTLLALKKGCMVDENKVGPSFADS